METGSMRPGSRTRAEEFDLQKKTEEELIAGYLRRPHYEGKLEWHGKKEKVYIKILSASGESIVVRENGISVESLRLFLPKEYTKYISPNKNPWDFWLINDLHRIKKGDFEVEFQRRVNKIREKRIGSFARSTFTTGKRYNCDLSASYNIAARFHMRILTKPLSATARSYIEAKVPGCMVRTTRTLSTLINCVAALKEFASSEAETQLYGQT